VSSLYRISALLFALAVLARLVFHQMTGFMADDAFITFRYAQHLAAGHGFVYNIGEHVLGTSTPLFTFILGLIGATGLDIPRTALAISLLCAGMTAVVIFRTATILRFTRWAALPAVMYILWPRSIVADSSGMETALFSLLIAAAIYYHTKRSPINALAMATLATLTRLEGAGLLVILLAYYLYTYRDRWQQILIVPAFLLGPWIAFATIYFGSPIPNSIPAKLALYSRFGADSWYGSLSYLMAWHHPLGWLIVASALVGGWWLWKKQFWGGLAAFWVLGMVAFYTVSKTHMFFWYPVPLYPVLLIFVAAVAPFVESRWRWFEAHALIMRPFVFVIVSAVLLLGMSSPIVQYREAQNEIDACHRAVATYLIAEATPDDLVAAEDIGYMGYYSSKRILDRDGLVSPEAVPYNRAGDYRGLVLDSKAAWVVAALDSPTSEFVRDSVFQQKYIQQKIFSGAACRYAVYKRRL
jgi:hypothetical protein